MEAWQRWQAWMQAKASRDVYEAFIKGVLKAGEMDQDQSALFNWPHSEGY